MWCRPSSKQLFAMSEWLLLAEIDIKNVLKKCMNCTNAEYKIWMIISQQSISWHVLNKRSFGSKKNP